MFGKLDHHLEEEKEIEKLDRNKVLIVLSDDPTAIEFPKNIQPDTNKLLSETFAKIETEYCQHNNKKHQFNNSIICASPEELATLIALKKGQKIVYGFVSYYNILAANKRGPIYEQNHSIFNQHKINISVEILKKTKAPFSFYLVDIISRKDEWSDEIITYPLIKTFNPYNLGAQL
ncbi:MAG: hypothetical protein WC570_04100 [Patescibacteria group bacterium]